MRKERDRVISPRSKRSSWKSKKTWKCCAFLTWNWQKGDLTHPSPCFYMSSFKVTETYLTHLANPFWQFTNAGGTFLQHCLPIYMWFVRWRGRYEQEKEQWMREICFRMPDSCPSLLLEQNSCYPRDMHTYLYIQTLTAIRVAAAKPLTVANDNLWRLTVSKGIDMCVYVREVSVTFHLAT